MDKFTMSGKIGLWIHNPSTALGQLHAIQAIGFDYVCVKISDGTNVYHAAETAQLVKDANSIGLGVVAWHYARPADITAQIAVVQSALPNGVTNIILDAEVEWETYANSHGTTGVSVVVAQLVSGIARATSANLHLSSFWSPKLHSSFPFASFVHSCVSWQPQAYKEPGSTRTTQSILDNSLFEGGKLVNTKTGQSVIPTINDIAFVPLLKAAGVKSFNVWDWDPKYGDAMVSDNRQSWTEAISKFREC